MLPTHYSLHNTLLFGRLGTLLIVVGGGEDEKESVEEEEEKKDVDVVEYEDGMQ